MRVSTRLVGALLTLALLHGSAAALVNDPAPRVAIRSCPSDLTREVGWLLEIELRTVDAGTQVAVSCADDAVKVVARDREEGRHVGRSLALGEVALSARARAVALAAAELVAALEGSPEPRPDSTEPTPADDEPQTVRRQASPAPASGRWELTASTTLGGLQRSFIYGGGLAVDHRPLRHLGWRAGLSAQSASRELGAGTGRALLASAAAALTLSWRARRARVTVGAGARVGVAWLGAETEDPDVTAGAVTGVWAGPLGLADVRLPAGPLWLSLGAELTCVTLPVKGRVIDEGTWGVDGLLVMGTAGLGLSL